MKLCRAGDTDSDVFGQCRGGKGARLPVKWMPPETLTDGISTEKKQLAN